MSTAEIHLASNTGRWQLRQLHVTSAAHPNSSLYPQAGLLARSAVELRRHPRFPNPCWAYRFRSGNRVIGAAGMQRENGGR